LVQVERLGRPGINEGLVLTNSSLNAFNSFPPTEDLNSAGDLAVSTIFSEIQTTLQVITAFGTLHFGSNQPGFANVSAGFIPDVLRINTENNFSPSDSSNSQDTGFTHMAYNGDYGLVGGSGAQVMLTGGRKIEDGVMNITLAYLFAGAAAATTNFTPKAVNGTGIGAGSPQGWSDNLTYDMGSTCLEASTAGGPLVPNGAALNNAQAPGHFCLYQQTARYGSANFPYLAAPAGTY
jgi:hypothetical protein